MVSGVCVVSASAPRREGWVQMRALVLFHSSWSSWSLLFTSVHVVSAYYDGIWDVRYIRQCATRGEVGPDEGRWCKERTGTFRVKVKYCHCDNKDGCNTASSMGDVKIWTSVTLALVTLLVSKLWVT